MKAMILAAGFGTRLRPLTDQIPKPLLPIGDQPLIFYALRLLRFYGYSEIMINLHHKAHLIRSELGDGKRFGLRITYSEEKTILGTGGGLKKVEGFFGGERFVLINSDILVDIHLNEVLAFHLEQKAMVTLVLRKDPNVDSYGKVEMGGDGRVRRFLGHPKEISGPVFPLMFTGVHIIEPRLFGFLPNLPFYSISDVYGKLVLEQGRIFGYEMTGYWLDVGTRDRYKKAQDDFVQGKLKFHYLTNGMRESF